MRLLSDLLKDRGYTPDDIEDEIERKNVVKKSPEKWEGKSLSYVMGKIMEKYPFYICSYRATEGVIYKLMKQAQASPFGYTRINPPNFATFEVLSTATSFSIRMKVMGMFDSKRGLLRWDK